eukprot:PLAT8215.1.p1 GENE.PLAT8215.1~~PLAT8215.1.p1  ORF type:complete len:256 (+),score=105.23 PLAT8215.1:39-806(+)
MADDAGGSKEVERSLTGAELEAVRSHYDLLLKSGLRVLKIMDDGDVKQRWLWMSLDGRRLVLGRSLFRSFMSKSFRVSDITRVVLGKGTERAKKAVSAPEDIILSILTESDEMSMELSTAEERTLLSAALGFAALHHDSVPGYKLPELNDDTRAIWWLQECHPVTKIAEDGTPMPRMLWLASNLLLNIASRRDDEEPTVIAPMSLKAVKAGRDDDESAVTFVTLVEADGFPFKLQFATEEDRDRAIRGLRAVGAP